MQKRHFEGLAEMVRDLNLSLADGVHVNDSGIKTFSAYTVAARLADFCQQQNPRFDRARFLAACGCAS